MLDHRTHECPSGLQQIGYEISQQDLDSLLFLLDVDSAWALQLVADSCGNGMGRKMNKEYTIYINKVRFLGEIPIFACFLNLLDCIKMFIEK